MMGHVKLAYLQCKVEKRPGTSYGGQEFCAPKQAAEIPKSGSAQKYAILINFGFLGT